MLINLTELVCKYDYDGIDYIDFDNIDIYNYDNHVEILKKCKSLNLNFKDFEEYYEKIIYKGYELEMKYYSDNPGDAKVIYYDYDDYREDYEDNKAEIWKEYYIIKYEDDIYDAIKEYKKDFFDKGYYINKINSKIFTLPNINKLSFSNKGKNINIMFQNIISVGAKLKLITFLEDKIPYYVDMTKTDDEWVIKLTHYITFDSHII